MNRRLSGAAALLCATLLAGCGKTGELDQPAPLFGAQAKADYAAQKQAEAQARAREDAARKAQPTAPVVDDAASEPVPGAPYSQALPGAAQNPMAPGPQGSLPNPGTAPDQ